MRRATGVLVRACAGLVLGSVVLAGCGGGGDPEPASAPTTGPPSDDDWEAAHAAYHDLAETYDAASAGAAAYQQTVQQVHTEVPETFATDARVTEALEGQRALAEERDQQTAALGEQPALRDPALKAAYDAFVAAAAEVNAFQDGFNESMPLYLQTFDACLKVFDLPKPKERFFVEVAAREWLTNHAKAAGPCLVLLDQLDDSGNYRIREFAEEFRQGIDERDQVVERMRDGQATVAQTSRRFDRVTKAFTARIQKVTDFNAEMEKLSAADEFRALDEVFEAELGTPTSSPTSSPSAAE